jgi:murein DD-endopeptidase MepM/ murein hydrolase activator NlpD
MAESLYVKPGDANFSVKYEDGGNAAKRTELEGTWKRFNRIDPGTGTNYYIWYRMTNRKSEVSVDYKMPINAPMGVYRVETFVPGKNATTTKAVFSVANNIRVEGGVPKMDDTIAVVDMKSVSDVWVSLGEFLLDPAKNPLSGRVRQLNISIEDPSASISFGPVRWVPLAQSGKPIEVVTAPSTPATTSQVVGPRFDAPMGTLIERNGPFMEGIVRQGFGPVWFGTWYDATPYLTWYFLGYHTGADLNLVGVSAADKDAPLYAVADGKVVFAGAAGSWGNIIVIEHPDAIVTLPSGLVQRQRVFSRYGHVTENILVAKDEQVERGKNIGFIGLATGMTTGWHLHFDIIYSDIGRTRPSHWPKMDQVKALKAEGKEGTREYKDAQEQVKKEVMAHYLDPFKFLKDNHNASARARMVGLR